MGGFKEGFDELLKLNGNRLTVSVTLLVESETTLLFVGKLVLFLVDKHLKCILEVVSLLLLEGKPTHQKAEQNDAYVPDIIFVKVSQKFCVVLDVGWWDFFGRRVASEFLIGLFGGQVHVYGVVFLEFFLEFIEVGEGEFSVVLG